MLAKDIPRVLFENANLFKITARGISDYLGKKSRYRRRIVPASMM